MSRTIGGAAVRMRRCTAPSATWQEWISEAPVSRESRQTTPSGIGVRDSQVDTASLRERIEQQAYFNWQARGCPHGSSDQDWLLAERQIHLESAATGAGRSN